MTDSTLHIAMSDKKLVDPVVNINNTNNIDDNAEDRNICTLTTSSTFTHIINDYGSIVAKAQRAKRSFGISKSVITSDIITGSDSGNDDNECNVITNH